MTKKKPQIEVERAYVETGRSQGYRVLVDRVWPRGITKEKLALDVWMKELAPSTELRKWFDHRAERWDEFRKRYSRELSGKSTEVDELLGVAKSRTLVLIYGARETEHNNAVALREYLLAR